MTPLKEYLASLKAIEAKATPEWSARCREFSNTERHRHIWSDPYGWVGEFKDVCDSEFAEHARSALPLLIAALEEAVGALEKIADYRASKGDEPDGLLDARIAAKSAQAINALSRVNALLEKP